MSAKRARTRCTARYRASPKVCHVALSLPPFLHPRHCHFFFKNLPIRLHLLPIFPAFAEFGKKFKDKTKASWEQRNDIKPAPGKYTPVDVADDDEPMPAVQSQTAKGGSSAVKIRPCTLDKACQSLVRLIFDHDMFKESMKAFDLDVDKMPLGKLSKQHIARGYEVLEVNGALCCPLVTSL